MSDVAIRVENLSKQYRIGKAARYQTLRERLNDVATAPLRWLRPSTNGHNGDPTTLWALKDVNFEVKRGEVVGIIGRNGAGKSTLLKILSRITDPTEGQVELHGRVGSLLEVGTGFHPELTGRENIYLNGAILGMKRREITNKFDEIVAFAEIEKFIDTAVKFYSSGMYMRLAFAVAAHLDPEILLVDEVLAVGDAQFQQKCLGKMGEVAADGRTVLFVSHNLLALKSICRYGIWLADGSVCGLGSMSDMVSDYLASQMQAGSKVIFKDNQNDRREARLVSIGVQDRFGRELEAVGFDEEFCVAIEYELRKEFPRYRVGVELSTRDGVILAVSTTEDSRGVQLPSRPGGYTAFIGVPANVLGPGAYLLGCFVDQPPVKSHDVRQSVLQFTVTGNPLPRGRRWEGIISLFNSWKIEQEFHDQQDTDGHVDKTGKKLDPAAL